MNSWPAVADRFDYGTLPTDTAAALQHSAERIRCLGSTQNSTIIEIGRELITAKSRLDHGQFTSWIEAEFRMSIRMAQRYMAVAERLADKNDIVSLFKPTALYALAAPSTPQSVHEDVTVRIKRGEVITTKDVKGLITTARIDVARAERKANQRRWNKIRRTRESDPTRVARQAKRLAREEAEREKQRQRRAQLAQDLADILRHRLGPDLARFVDLANDPDFSWWEFREVLSQLQQGEASRSCLAQMQRRGELSHG